MKEKNTSFKSRLTELEEIYHLIQNSDDSDLDKLIGLYERGIKLANSLEKDIQKYELRIQEITAQNTITNNVSTNTDDSDQNIETTGYESLEEIQSNANNDTFPDNNKIQKKRNKSQKKENNNSLF